MTTELKPSNVWAWVGVLVSVGLNIALVWVLILQLSKPEGCLCPPDVTVQVKK